MSNNFNKINGLIVAPFTPMNPDRSINYDLIKKQASIFSNNKLSGVFICGTTGESLSLTIEERMQISEKWKKYIDKQLLLIVHVGSECLLYAKELAKHAQSIGANAIATIGPTFFRPSNIKDLVEFCYEIASAAPELPFYYYHIPSMTGLNFKMNEFLKYAENRISNLAGIKYTHEDLYDFNRCMEYKNSKYDILFGRDEILLAGLSLGARGAVGSFYNFASPIFYQILLNFNRGNIKRAQQLQKKVQDFTEIYFKFGGNVATGKAIMRIAGLDCGPVRLPLVDLSKPQYDAMKKELDKIDFKKRFVTI